jgi:hypothetical protein
MGTLRMNTVHRYLVSLSVAHSEHGVESPTGNPQIKLLLRHLQRAQAHRRPNKKSRAHCRSASTLTVNL